jgi:hypothetical protein
MENQIEENETNKYKKPLIVIVLIVIITGITAYYFTKDKAVSKEIPIAINDTIIKKDSLSKTEKESLEKNGFYAELNFAVANKAYIRSAPNKAQNNIIDTLDFGQNVYIKNVYTDEGDDTYSDESILENERKNGFVAVYRTKPKKISDKPFGYVSEKVIVSQYEFDNYKESFSLKEFSILDVKIKKAIIENSYYNNQSYTLTQNSQRAPHVLTTGDFDGDGTKEFAVILDNVQDGAASSLLIFLTNKETKEFYLTFRESYTDFFKINFLQKGSTILENAQETVLSNDAISIMADEYKTIAFVYDSEAGKFISYEQITP